MAESNKDSSSNVDNSVSLDPTALLKRKLDNQQINQKIKRMKMTIISEEKDESSLRELRIHSQEDLSKTGLSAKAELEILDDDSSGPTLLCYKQNTARTDTLTPVATPVNLITKPLTNMHEKKKSEKDGIFNKNASKGPQKILHCLPFSTATVNSLTPPDDILTVNYKRKNNLPKSVDQSSSSEDNSKQKNVISQQSKNNLTPDDDTTKGNTTSGSGKFKNNEWVKMTSKWTELDEGEITESSNESHSSTENVASSLLDPSQSNNWGGYSMFPPVASYPCPSPSVPTPLLLPIPALSPMSTPIHGYIPWTPHSSPWTPNYYTYHSPNFCNLSMPSISPNCNLSKWSGSSSSPGSIPSYPCRRKLYSLPEYDVQEIFNISSDLKFIDTHCHLDFLFKRSDFKGSFSNYKRIHSDTFPSNFEGCIAVFCDPQTFGKFHYWRAFLNEDNVWGAFGCHPHMAKEYNDSLEEYMKLALDHPSCIALGEIGLDYSSKNTTDKEIQKDVFQRQLHIALERQLPLVIHSRDAYEDTMEILKKLVPKDYNIHRHCFTGNWSEAQTWLETFPNLYLGITALVTFQTASEVHEVVRRIPLNRLLLETDAPYFLPRQVNKQKKFSHPGMAIHVAAQIAALRFDATTEDILKITRENTKNMYGI